LLQDGQEIVVQVLKDPIGTKGARLTMQITLPARYLVFLPYSKHIGISQKIGDEATRERLRALVQSAIPEGAEEGGYILRTLAETAAEEEIETDIRYLRRVWAACRERIRTAAVRSLIRGPALALRAMPTGGAVTLRRYASIRARYSSRRAISASNYSGSPIASSIIRASGLSSICIPSDDPEGAR
jgi:hypothetical protein